MRGLHQLTFMEMWGEEARHQESESVLRPHSVNIHARRDTCLLTRLTYCFNKHNVPNLFYIFFLVFKGTVPNKSYHF